MSVEMRQHHSQKFLHTDLYRSLESSSSSSSDKVITKRERLNELFESGDNVVESSSGPSMSYVHHKKRYKLAAHLPPINVNATIVGHSSQTSTSSRAQSPDSALGYSYEFESGSASGSVASSLGSPESSLTRSQLPTPQGSATNGQMVAGKKVATDIGQTALAIDNDQDLEDDKKRKPFCARCRNHNVLARLKGHKRRCPFNSCLCDGCMHTAIRRKVMANNVATSRRQDDDARYYGGVLPEIPIVKVEKVDVQEKELRVLGDILKIKEKIVPVRTSSSSKEFTERERLNELFESGDNVVESCSCPSMSYVHHKKRYKLASSLPPINVNAAIVGHSSQTSTSSRAQSPDSAFGNSYEFDSGSATSSVTSSMGLLESSLARSPLPAPQGSATNGQLKGAAAKKGTTDSKRTALTTDTDQDINDDKKRKPVCARCKNHNVLTRLKGHKRRCPFNSCLCDWCMHTVIRRKVMANNVATSRRQIEDARFYGGLLPEIPIVKAEKVDVQEKELRVLGDILKIKEKIVPVRRGKGKGDDGSDLGERDSHTFEDSASHGNGRGALVSLTMYAH